MATGTRHRAPGGGRLVLVAAVALVVGMASQALLSDATEENATRAADEHNPQVAPPARNTSPGPAGVVNGIPSGFARSRPGAVAAAAGFVCTGQALLDSDPLAAEEAVRSMASSASADAQVADTLRHLRATREALAGGTGRIVYRQAAIAYRVDSWTPERARVLVWNVGVLSRDDVAPPQAAWATSSVELVWERGDWRIWSETISPGPAPVLNDSTAPATSAELAAALEGFTDFGVAR